MVGIPARGASRNNSPESDRSLPFQTVCRMVAWLPRKPAANLAGSRKWSKPRVWNQGIEDLDDIDLFGLRKAIRANLISFPSEPPIFPSCGKAYLQRRLVRHYFVMGGSLAKIAKRYELSAQQVQRILNAWKRQAAGAGYIQRIPPAM